MGKKLLKQGYDTEWPRRNCSSKMEKRHEKRGGK